MNLARLQGYDRPLDANCANRTDTFHGAKKQPLA